MFLFHIFLQLANAIRKDLFSINAILKLDNVNVHKECKARDVTNVSMAIGISILVLAVIKSVPVIQWAHMMTTATM